MSLRRDSQKQLRSYQIDRFEYANAMVFKRIAELENNQDILHRITENNKGNPEVQVKAVAQLNETIMLISDLRCYLKFPIWVWMHFLLLLMIQTNL